MVRERVGSLVVKKGEATVGTPVVVFQPPDGLAFFGPVISRIPDDADALRLWDAVLTLGAWPGFAEIKRTMREMPQLPLLER